MPSDYKSDGAGAPNDPNTCTCFAKWVHLFSQIHAPVFHTSLIFYCDRWQIWRIIYRKPFLRTYMRTYAGEFFLFLLSYPSSVIFNFQFSMFNVQYFCRKDTTNGTVQSDFPFDSFDSFVSFFSFDSFDKPVTSSRPYGHSRWIWHCTSEPVCNVLCTKTKHFSELVIKICEIFCNRCPLQGYLL